MRKVLLPLIFVIGAISGSAVNAQTGSQADQLASKLVNNVLHVKQNQIVLINADPSNMQFAESLVTSLRQVGAFGILTMGSNRETALYFQRVPAKYDSQPPLDLLALSKIATAIVQIQYPPDPNATRGVPAARLNATTTAFNSAFDSVTKRSVPYIFLGNGVMPSEAAAKRFGVSQQQLRTLYWAGLNTDYTSLHNDAVAMQKNIMSSRVVRVTSPNGTNFTFRALANAGQINDGMISAADRKKGGLAVQKWLPAGDVYFIPQPGTASGTIVFGDTTYINGEPVTGMKMTFQNGKVTSMHAASGESAVAKFYSTGGPGRDQFGFIDLGVNRSMSLPPGRWGFGPSMAAGFISAGVGGNLGFGGTNRSPFGFYSNIPNGTVTLDGNKVVIDGGKLVTSRYGF